jgi:hypothetical protein
VFRIGIRNRIRIFFASRFRIRIHWTEVRIRISTSGSVSKCHGSTTLQTGYGIESESNNNFIKGFWPGFEPKPSSRMVKQDLGSILTESKGSLVNPDPDSDPDLDE